MNDASQLAYTALLLAAFAGLWLIVLWTLARIGGWTRLAERYGTREPFVGKKYRLQTARMNRVFTNCLTVGAGPSGLYLATLHPFRSFHGALLIPWEDIRAQRFDSGSSNDCRLTFKTLPGVTLELDEANRSFDCVMRQVSAG